MPLTPVNREKDYIGGLQIGENLAAHQEGVGVQETVGEREQHGEPERVRRVYHNEAKPNRNDRSNASHWTRSPNLQAAWEVSSHTMTTRMSLRENASRAALSVPTRWNVTFAPTRTYIRPATSQPLATSSRRSPTKKPFDIRTVVTRRDDRRRERRGADQVLTGRPGCGDDRLSAAAPRPATRRHPARRLARMDATQGIQHRRRSAWAARHTRRRRRDHPRTRGLRQRTTTSQ